MGGSADTLLNEDAKKKIESAVSYYRNLGLLQMEAIGRFSKEFPDFLEQFGSTGNSAQEASLPRQMVEKYILDQFNTAWSKPAVLNSGAAPSTPAAPPMGGPMGSGGGMPPSGAPPAPAMGGV